MAEIKMELSEYKLIEKNTKLLEDALTREKELTHQIDLLNKEKIQILENSKYSVTYLRRTRKYKSISRIISEEHALQLIRRFVNYGDYINNSMSSNKRPIDLLFESIYKTEESEIHYDEINEPIETKGLEEVKTELRKVEIEKLGKEFERLKSLEKEFKEIEKLKNEISKQSEYNIKSLCEIKEKNDIILEKNNTILELQKNLNSYERVISEIKNYCVGLLFNGKRPLEIINTLNIKE